MDRRPRKTRHALQGALLRLLTQRPWEEIDVQTLCNDANVGRSTFYEHYQNREALLLEAFSEIGAGFSKAGIKWGHHGPATLTFLAPMMDHIQQQRIVFRALLGKRSNAYVRQQFQSMLVLLIHAGLEPYQFCPKWRGELLAHAIGGAVFASIHWWVATNDPRRAEDITALIDAQAKAMLRETIDRV